MKTQLISLIIALALGSTLMAKDLTITACTADRKVAALGVSFVDETPANIEAEVRKAFTEAAKGLTAEELQGREGFLAFMAGLSDEDREYVAGLSGVPTITGDTCE